MLNSLQDKSLQIERPKLWPTALTHSNLTSPQWCLDVTDANITIMEFWMEEGGKGKRQVIDGYGVMWEAK